MQSAEFIATTTNTNQPLTAIKYEQHPFHLVKPSPWPFQLSMSLSNLSILLVLKLHGIVAINSNCLFLYLIYQTNRVVFVGAIVSWF
jgi:cytochrome c oxidase subunit 3